ncbi:MAG: HutD family protein [Alphaproteobacteria bacterium]|nr:HutD family protein [Alphaproteobacteria bacterium]
MSARLLPAGGHVDMPWKNGLGRTTEIARAPASGDGFDWRLSIASIDRDGAFSAFAGCDRTLVPIAGGGLALDFDGGETLRGELFEPMRFAGDRPCFGRLLAGPARDLNVITRRAAARHDVAILTGSTTQATTGNVSFVVGVYGSLTIATNDGRWRLDVGDALRIDGHGVALRLMAISEPARAALVSIALRPPP